MTAPRLSCVAASFVEDDLEVGARIVTDDGPGGAVDPHSIATTHMRQAAVAGGTHELFAHMRRAPLADSHVGEAAVFRPRILHTPEVLHPCLARTPCVIDALAPLGPAGKPTRVRVDRLALRPRCRKRRSRAHGSITWFPACSRAK